MLCLADSFLASVDGVGGRPRAVGTRVPGRPLRPEQPPGLTDCPALGPGTQCLLRAPGTVPPVSCVSVTARGVPDAAHGHLDLAPRLPSPALRRANPSHVPALPLCCRPAAGTDGFL